MSHAPSVWPLLDAAVGFSVALSFACGGSEPGRFRSQVDGDRPILLVASDKLKAWSASLGTPAGARWRMLEAALPFVSPRWLPSARGAVQLVPVDLDDQPAGPCTLDRYSLWSVPGMPAIWVCPVWEGCMIEGDPTLYGQAGCNLGLLHELGHVLGARQHSERGNRPLHLSGDVMCGWASDCIDPKLTDYTNEDVALICGDGGHGGRCLDW